MKHYFFEMTDDRNLTSHTYDEEFAQNLYKKVMNYYEPIKTLFERIKKLSEL